MQELIKLLKEPKHSSKKDLSNAFWNTEYNFQIKGDTLRAAFTYALSVKVLEGDYEILKNRSVKTFLNYLSKSP